MTREQILEEIAAVRAQVARLGRIEANLLAELFEVSHRMVLEENQGMKTRLVPEIPPET